MSEQIHWIDVDKKLPACGKRVLVSMNTEYSKGLVCIAEHAGYNTLEIHPDADGGIYDEKTDTFYCEEGWYESNMFDEIHWAVDGTVTHWMPLVEGVKNV